MRLVCLGSGSSGNCYILKSESDTLIIDCGIHIKEVKKALDFNYSGNILCLISHQDRDHCKYVKEITQMGIDVYCLKATADTFGFESIRLHHIEPKKPFIVGNFKIMGFSLVHDVPNLGYLISHNDNNILYATDTHYIPYTFPNLNNIMVEMNYSNEIADRNLASGKLSVFVRNRVLFSHMEAQTTIDFLKANDLSKVNNICLLHLSDGNSNAPDFQRRVQELTGKSVFVAQTGLDISFDKQPF
jgi:phosphoribosyl 1,2-cyclic phosphodiesterase